MIKQKKSSYIRLGFLIFFLAFIFVGYMSSVGAETIEEYRGRKTYSGVQDQIREFLCTPADNNSGNNHDFFELGSGSGTGMIDQNVNRQLATNAASGNAASSDLYLCINKLYRFAIAISTSIAIFFIVIAGYIWMSAEGNKESVDKAKSILASTLTALVILFIGYILLRALNPDLIKFGNLQPPSVVLDSAKTPDQKSLTEYAEQIPENVAKSATLGSTNVSAGAKAAAISILTNSKIQLLNSHVSSTTKGPESTAKQNILDTSNGKSASCSQTVVACTDKAKNQTALYAPMLEAIIKIGNSFGPVRISTIAGGIHSSPSSSSQHYQGRAFDIDMVQGKSVTTLSTDNSQKQLVKNISDLCRQNGAKWVGDVFSAPSDHTNHIHCQW